MQTKKCGLVNDCENTLLLIALFTR